MKWIIGTLAFVGALGVFAASEPARAERPNAAAMTCDAAAQKILANGALVMQIGPVSYDRFVASRAFCAGHETTEPATISTRDNPSCLIGYRCREMPGRSRR